MIKQRDTYSGDPIPGFPPVSSAKGLASYGILCARPLSGPSTEIPASQCGQSCCFCPHSLGKKPTEALRAGDLPEPPVNWRPRGSPARRVRPHSFLRHPPPPPWVHTVPLRSLIQKAWPRAPAFRTRSWRHDATCLLRAPGLRGTGASSWLPRQNRPARPGRHIPQVLLQPPCRGSGPTLATRSAEGSVTRGSGRTAEGS